MNLVSSCSNSISKIMCVKNLCAAGLKARSCSSLTTLAKVNDNKLMSSKLRSLAKLCNEQNVPCEDAALRFYHDKNILFNSICYKSDSETGSKTVENDYKPLLTSSIIKRHEAKLSESVNSNAVTRLINNTTRSEEAREIANESIYCDDVEDHSLVFNEYGKEIVIGSAAPNVPKSRVRCTGCGAFQHCNDPALPGFKPYEMFVGYSDVQLSDTVCHHCQLMRNFDTVIPNRRIPKQIHNVLRTVFLQNNLVLLLVDLTDVPCSIHPEMLKMLRKDQPVIIVGTKVDLLPRASDNCLNDAIFCLSETVRKTDLPRANIVATVLVSGHTGYGVEDLVTLIYTHWHSKGKFHGNIFLVGSTNCGKSTLFNALLNSDLSQFSAMASCGRATVSTWPSTTVNLLRFPMLKWLPYHWKKLGLEHYAVPFKYLRHQRLSEDREVLVSMRLRSSKNKLSYTKDVKEATVEGRIKRTMVINQLPTAEAKQSLTTALYGDSSRASNWSEDNTFCYDTPGLVQPDQFQSLLTHDELSLVMPSQLIIPESFKLRPGLSLFIAGLARLDLLHLHAEQECDILSSFSTKYVKVTVFRSSCLPVSIVPTVSASSFYRDYLGTSLLRVPTGPAERLSYWPALRPQNVLLVGKEDRFRAAGDVVLSSAGWISVTMDKGIECSLRAWTPAGRGIYLRLPSLVPYTIFEHLKPDVIIPPNEVLYPPHVLLKKPSVLPPEESSPAGCSELEKRDEYLQRFTSSVNSCLTQTYSSRLLLRGNNKNSVEGSTERDESFRNVKLKLK